MYVALGVEREKRMRHIVICGMSGFTIIFHIISYTARFFFKRYLTQNVCFDFLYKFCLQHFSF
jgi:tRNA A22 N-methylase